MDWPIGSSSVKIGILINARTLGNSVAVEEVENLCASS